MKKGICLSVRLTGIVVLILIFSTTTRAQIVQKGIATVQIGYGFPSAMHLVGTMFNYAIAGEDSTASSGFKYRGFGPFHLRFEYMVSDKLGIGLSTNAEFGSFRVTTNYTDDSKNNVTGIRKFRYSGINAILRLNYHFIRKPEKVDVYYGFGIGYASNKAKLDTVGIDPISEQELGHISHFDKYINGAFKKLPIALEQVLGVKVPLSPTAGVYFEVGYSKSLFQLGFYGKLGGGKGHGRNDWRWY